MISKLLAYKLNKIELECRVLRAKNDRLQAIVEADSQIIKALNEENVILQAVVEGRK